MSSVTRLHLLSQSMLNVSCQKQKHCSPFPADSLTDSPMEFVGQPRPCGACNLLGVPGLSSLDVDDDEGEVVIGIWPKSSPLPRRKSSVTDDDSDPEPPLCGSRRVSFADAKGLSLVQVKEFETWDVPTLPGYDVSQGEGKCTDEYFLCLHTFSLPLSTEELFIKVQDQKVELETIELLPGTTILKGVIRVLNISFSKAVYVRITLDMWSSHFDLLAEYIPGSSDGLMDSFSFKLTLVPPFGEQGARVDFCLRYETPVGTFWANNNNRNYVLYCHHRMRDQKEKPQKENVNKKSCLKPVSQNLTVENNLAVETSSEENISTDLPMQGDQVNTVKNKQISDDQARTSEEDEQKLQAENRRNSSQRNRRKAARMDRVRDYFAQRDGGADDTERDESPPEAKQAAQQENPVEKHSEMPSFSEAGSNSEGFQFVSETVEPCSEPLSDVVNDTSQAHNYTCNSEPEKSENSYLADAATLTGGESATDIPDNTLHSNEEPASVEGQNMYMSVSEGDEKNLKQGTICESTSNYSVISAISSESFVSQTNSFTFGSVVAPLYQVLGRLGSENQSVCNRRDPVWATPNHTEIRESSSPGATDARRNDDRVQKNDVMSQESNQECSYAVRSSPPIEETSLNVMENNTLDHGDTLQDPVEILHSDQSYRNRFEPKPLCEDIEARPQIGNILNMDSVNALVPEESLYPLGEAQEDNLTFDLQSQAAADLSHAQLPEHMCSQMKTNVDEITAQIQTEEVVASLETSLSRSECVSETVQHTSSSGENVFKCVDEANTDTETDKSVTISPTSFISEEDNLEEALHDMNPNPIDTKETANSYISCCGAVDEYDFTTHETLLETKEETDDVGQQNPSTTNLHDDKTKDFDTEIDDELAESMTKANRTRDDTADMFVEFRDEETISGSEKIKHYKMEATVSREEDFSFAEPTEVKNGEIIVEEEKKILTGEEESKTVYLKDTDPEEDQGEQMGDTGRDTNKQEKEKMDEALVENNSDTRKKENKTEHAGVLEDKQSLGEENGDVSGKNRDVEKDLEYAEATQIERIVVEDEPVEETKAEKREKQDEEEKHFTEMQEVKTERPNVQKEDGIVAEEEMEIDTKGDDKADVNWDDPVKPREENVEDKKWDYKEEMLLEAGEAKIVDSEDMTLEGIEDEVGCFEERLGITQNMVEDGLSALVNNLQVKDKENTGERQHAHIPAEMHFYKEEDFQSSKNATHDRSKAENECAATEGGLCILTDEPEGDQTSHSSASAESDSDDEVELYMHCLRAVHTGTQANKDRNTDAASTGSKRPSVSRSKHVSTPMPSISESLDEDQQLSYPQDNNELEERTDIQATGTALSGGQDHIDRNVSWWKKTFSCSNISKTLLYATLLVVFLVAAYHYDFLACFGLYLVSVVWLCCQGETQPVKNDHRIG